MSNWIEAHISRVPLVNVAMLMCLVAVTIGLSLLGNKTMADGQVKSTASVTVPEACTMTSTNNAPHTATISPNTYSGASGSEYENGIGKTTLTAICNDYNGFAIYAIGFTGNSYDSENHTKLVGSNTNGTIATKAYQSGDITSNWSMKLTKVTNTSESYNPENLNITNSYNDWNVVPATYTKVAEYHANTGSSTTDTTLGAKVETTYAAYIASNQPADTYLGQVKYTMVHPYDNTPKDGPITDCPANRICYSPNTNDIEGTMGQQTINNPTTSTSITLLASNFSRKGYGFAGWSNRYDYSNDNGAKFYGPNETISFTAGQYNTTNGGLRLYAIWIPSQGSLQDSSKVTALCGANGSGGSLVVAPTDGTANLDSVSALTDQRDNDTYAIAKLADGNCWMIENLRLDSTAANNTSGSLAQGYGSSFFGLASPESPWANNSTIDNSLYSAEANVGNKNTILGSNQGYRFPRYNNVNTPINASDRPQNPTSNSATNSATNAGMFSYGNYYTWAAAIADTTEYPSGNHNTTSICPTGWKIPLGNASTGSIDQGASDAANKVPGFSYLDRKMGGNGQNQSTTADSLRWRKYPTNYIFSGGINNSSVSSRSNYSAVWSSTANSFDNVSYLYLTSSYVSPSTGLDRKYYGRVIRCVADTQ